MRKTQLMNDILMKHGGKTVREDGRNYWIKGDEKILITGGFLFKKLKESVVIIPQIEEKVIPVVMEPVITIQKPKPIIKKKIVVEKPKEPDVES